MYTCCALCNVQTLSVEDRKKFDVARGLNNTRKRKKRSKVWISVSGVVSRDCKSWFFLYLTTYYWGVIPITLQKRKQQSSDDDEDEEEDGSEAVMNGSAVHVDGASLQLADDDDADRVLM